jgi:CDP-paratose 2-epimerase
MSTILVTGACGLTGKACVEHFTKKGWDVVGIDINARAHFFGTDEQKPLDYGKFFAIDIRDEQEINALFDRERFDAIIHCASQPSHDYSTDHVLEDFDINARGTLILLEATRKYCPEATFVFCSTDKVYGENMTCFLTEFTTRYSPSVPHRTEGFTEAIPLDMAGDRSFFGCSKLAADMYVQQYGAKFGMKTACFRLGCITGKNHQGSEQHGFLSYLAKCIKEEKTYKVHGNGKQVRDQIHANDLARAFFEYVGNPTVGGVYNIGGGPERAVSVLEAGELISKELGKPFLYTFAEERKGDRRYDVHDVSKFRKDYPNWEYHYSLDDIIKDICS